MDRIGRGDQWAETVRALSNRLRAAAGGAAGGAAVLLIDGRSGSGKTLLADEVAAEFHRATGASSQLLRVEHMYPGWDGLAAGAMQVPAALRTREYQKYDWTLGRFTETCRIAATAPLIVEGCGAVAAESLLAAREFAAHSGAHSGAHASDHSAAVCASGRPSEEAFSPGIFSVWLESPAPVRRNRALERDGDTYRPHWDRWSRQENEWYGAHRPWQLADEVLQID